MDVTEAHEIFHDKARDNGSICPVCDRFGKQNPTTMDRVLAWACVRLARHQVEEGIDTWIQCQEFWAEIKSHMPPRTVYCKLRHWGLLEKNPEKGPKGQRNTAVWRVTRNGLLFAAGRLRVRLKAIVYNRQLIEYAGVYIDVHEAIESGDFDYEAAIEPVRRLLDEDEYDDDGQSLLF